MGIRNLNKGKKEPSACAHKKKEAVAILGNIYVSVAVCGWGDGEMGRWSVGTRKRGGVESCLKQAGVCVSQHTHTWGIDLKKIARECGKK